MNWYERVSLERVLESMYDASIVPQQFSHASALNKHVPCPLFAFLRPAITTAVLDWFWDCATTTTSSSSAIMEALRRKKDFVGGTVGGALAGMAYGVSGTAGSVVVTPARCDGTGIRRLEFGGG